jgi:hypothetical protein
VSRGWDPEGRAECRISRKAPTRSALATRRRATVAGCLPDLAVVTVSDHLASLHDSSLTGVEVSWASAIARIVIEVDTAAARAGSLPLAGSPLLDGPDDSGPDFAGTVVIECRGLRCLAIPREEPWGPSNYINAVVLKANDRGVQIEMCSGDLIDIVSDDVTIAHAGSGA